MNAQIKALRAAATEAKRKRDEWIQVFGASPTRGLVLMEKRLVVAQRNVCAAESRAAVREAFGAKT